MDNFGAPSVRQESLSLKTMVSINCLQAFYRMIGSIFLLHNSAVMEVMILLVLTVPLSNGPDKKERTKTQ